MTEKRVTRQDIEKFINTLPEERQQSMRQLQWKIDAVLARYKDPIARMNKMVEMMWEEVAQLQQALSNPQSMIESERAKPKATVISLRNRTTS